MLYKRTNLRKANFVATVAEYAQLEHPDEVPLAPVVAVALVAPVPLPLPPLKWVGLQPQLNHQHVLVIQISCWPC